MSYTEMIEITTASETRTRTITMTPAPGGFVIVETTETAIRADGSSGTRRTTATITEQAARELLPAGAVLSAAGADHRFTAGQLASTSAEPGSTLNPDLCGVERSWAWSWPAEAPTCAPARTSILDNLYDVLGGCCR